MKAILICFISLTFQFFMSKILKTKKESVLSHNDSLSQ